MKIFFAVVSLLAGEGVLIVIHQKNEIELTPVNVSLFVATIFLVMTSGYLAGRIGRETE